MDPNGAPLPQVPEVPVAPPEAITAPLVTEATQSNEQVVAQAPIAAESTFHIPPLPGVGVETPTNPITEGVSTQEFSSELPPHTVAGPQPAASFPEAPTVPIKMDENSEPEVPDTPSLKDVNAIERYREPDELGQALEATLGSEVG